MYNTIDYETMTDYPITGCGYIPNDDYIIDNYDELLKHELNEKSLIKKNNDRNISIEQKLSKDELMKNISSLFACKSKNHKFSQEYLEFLTFCLSLLMNSFGEKVLDFDPLLDY